GVPCPSSLPPDSPPSMRRMQPHNVLCRRACLKAPCTSSSSTRRELMIIMPWVGTRLPTRARAGHRTRRWAWPRFWAPSVPWRGGLIVSTFAESFIPIIAGAGVGAYVGAVAGAVSGMDRRRARVDQPARPTQRGEGRPSGVMLAVNAEAAREQDIVGILREAGGEAIERAQGRWRDGAWEDFDPLKPPVPQSAQDASSRP